MTRVAPESAIGRFLPREHGFWTMLAAVVFTAIVRAGASGQVFLTAAGVVVVAVLLGGFFRRAVRRNESLQLASSLVMGFAGVPIELVGGVDLASTALTTLVWAIVFVSSALCVRASFAQASRARQKKARALQLGSVSLPLVAAAFFALGGEVAPTVAALVAAVGATALVLKRPGVKQMKAVGLSLAGVATLAAVALAFL